MYVSVYCVAPAVIYNTFILRFFSRAQATVAGYGNPDPRTRRLPLRDAALHSRNLPLRIIQGTQSVLLEGA